jgi:hypothetical protein
MSVTDTFTEKSSLRRQVSAFLGGVFFRSAWLFGTAVSAAAFISFIQLVFEVHLVPPYAHWLSVYREVLHSTVTTVYSPFVLLAERIASLWFHFSLRISIPAWWKDLATISTVNAAANLRGAIVAHRQLSLGRVVGYIVAVFVYGLTLIGLLLFAVPLLWISLLIPPNDSEDRYLTALLWSVWRPYLLSLFAIAVAAALFFVTNAYQL